MNRTNTIFMTAFALVVVALAFGVKDLSSSTGLDPAGPGEVSPPDAGDVTKPQEPVNKPANGNLACSPGAAQSATATLGAGSIRASLSHGKILQTSADEVFASFDIQIEELALEDRPPLNLSLVIDRSGSMRGPPMQHARNAAVGLVQRLGPTDRVSVVTYDSVAEVVVPSTTVDARGKQRLIASIQGIHPRGMTNIQGGLILGYQELDRGLTQGTISRMVHISDGIANVGVTDTASLVRLASDAAQRGIRTTSVGLGEHYNETLMEGLAEAGRGQYYYVRNGAALDAVFAGELKNIQATIATQVELRIEPCDGVQVIEVYGLTSRREGSATVVALADLSGGDNRRVVARLSTSGAPRGRLPVMNATLRYQDVDQGRTRYATMALAAGTTSDSSVADASVDRDVMAQVIEVQGAVALRTATASYGRGDRVGATRQLEQTQRELTDRAERYQVRSAPAARRSIGVVDNFRGLFGASADALAGQDTSMRDVQLRAQDEARSMERERRD